MNASFIRSLVILMKVVLQYYKCCYNAKEHTIRLDKLQYLVKSRVSGQSMSKSSKVETSIVRTKRFKRMGIRITTKASQVFAYLFTRMHNINETIQSYLFYTLQFFEPNAMVWLKMEV